VTPHQTPLETPPTVSETPPEPRAETPGATEPTPKVYLPDTPYDGYTPGMFGGDDLILGTYPGGNLRETVQVTGGTTVNTIVLEPGEAYNGAIDLSLTMVKRWRTQGRPIRFVLERLEDLPGVFSGKAYPKSVTAAELRFLKQNWAEYEKLVTFWLEGKQVRRPW
jgi:hypothetical protein